MEQVIDRLNQILHNNGLSRNDRLNLIISKLQHGKMPSNIQTTESIIQEIDQCFNSLQEIDHPDMVQKVFMMFGEKILKTSLDQFYTPTTIGRFIARTLNHCDNILEPACGTGDLAIFCDAKKITFVDINEEVCELTRLNLSLKNPAYTYEVVTQNSLQTITHGDSKNIKYDVVIINPPFGCKTIEKDKNLLNLYSLGKDRNKQQLGKLFVEYGMQKLKANGILFIIVPRGYMTNGSDKDMRDLLLSKYKVVAVIDLPENTFKRSGTGVDTCLLIVENVQTTSNYRIFLAKCNRIGIDTRLKNTPYLYKQDGQTLDNDLDDIALAFESFNNDYSISNHFIKKIQSTACPLAFVIDKNTIVESYESSFPVQRIINSNKQQDITRGFTVGSSLLKPSKAKIENNKTYIYLDISEIKKGSYDTCNLMKGSILPGRASYSVLEGDILISKLKGKPSYCIVQQDYENIIVTNGVFIVRFDDKNEKERLSFIRYLFTSDFVEQFNSLACGSIMATVKDKDFCDCLVIPYIDNNDMFDDVKQYLDSYRILHQTKRKLMTTIKESARDQSL